MTAQLAPVGLVHHGLAKVTDTIADEVRFVPCTLSVQVAKTCMPDVGVHSLNVLLNRASLCNPLSTESTMLNKTPSMVSDDLHLRFRLQ